MSRIVWYFFYYAFAYHLPQGDRWGIIGKISAGIRRFLCKSIFAKTSKNFNVGKGVDFCYLGHLLRLDNHANLGNYLKIKGNGGVRFGRHIMMGDDVTIITQDHKYLAEGYDGYVKGEVIIGDYTWIGDRTIILKGVEIGEHSIIGAGSVVTKDVPHHSIAVGNPARVIKTRH